MSTISETKKLVAEIGTSLAELKQSLGTSEGAVRQREGPSRKCCSWVVDRC